MRVCVCVESVLCLMSEECVALSLTVVSVKG